MVKKSPASIPNGVSISKIPSIVDEQTLLQSYADPNFRGDRIARDASIEFLSPSMRPVVFAAAVAVLSQEVEAFEEFIQYKRGAGIPSVVDSKDANDAEFKTATQLRERLRILVDLQFKAVDRSDTNAPFRDDAKATRMSTLPDIAFKLSDAELFRRLATLSYEGYTDQDTKREYLKTLLKKFVGDDSIAQKVLDLIRSKTTDPDRKLEFLQACFQGNQEFNELVVYEVLSSFDGFLPDDFTNADQGKLLEFLGHKMTLEQSDDIYERFFKLDLVGPEAGKIELVLLDRIHALRQEQRDADIAMIESGFREQLGKTNTIPEGWTL